MKRFLKIVGIGAVSAAVTAGVASVIRKVVAVRKFDEEKFYSEENPEGGGYFHAKWHGDGKVTCPGYEAHHMPSGTISFCPYNVEGCLSPSDFDRPLSTCPCAGLDSCLRSHTLINSYDGSYFGDLIEAFGGHEPDPTTYEEQLGAVDGVSVDFGESCGEDFDADADESFDWLNESEDEDEIGDDDSELGLDTYDPEELEDEALIDGQDMAGAYLDEPDDSGVDFCEEDEDECGCGCDGDCDCGGACSCGVACGCGGACGCSVADADSDACDGADADSAACAGADDEAKKACEEKREKFRAEGMLCVGSWEDFECEELKTMLMNGVSIEECASHFNRSVQATARKACKLGIAIET